MRITIKARILAMVILLLIILLGNSIWAILNFQGLKDSIENIMQANYQSIEVGQEMVASLERQDAAVLSYLFLNKSPDAVAAFRENEGAFLKNLARAEDNITEPGEEELLKTLNSAYSSYLLKFTAFLQLDSTSATSYYYSEMRPVLDTCKSAARSLIELNQRGMLGRRSNTEHMATQATLSTSVIAAGTILAGLVIAVIISNRIIVPINNLIHKMKRIEEGDYSHQIPVTGDDEIAVLAGEYNIMAEQLRIYAQMNFEKIMQEKQKAEAIVEGISDGVILTDRENRILLMNPAAEKALGIKEQDALNRHILETVKRDDIFAAIQNVRTRNAVEKEPLDITIRRGEHNQHYRVTPNLIGDQEHDEAGVVTLLQDITRLKEIDQLKSDFVATVSHEFRTPLTSITMAVGLLLDGTAGETGPKQRNLAESIQEDCFRLNNLVTELLDLSKIEAGIMQIDFKRCRIQDIIKVALKPFEKPAMEKGVQLLVEADDNLPPIRADFNKMIWVVSNLVGNALRYTPDDGSGEIRINARIHSGKLEVSVSDNGSGIAANQLDRIFDKYVQIPNDSGQMGSAGLGLAISREIVVAHGGEIHVTSESGQGSTFTFTLKN